MSILSHRKADFFRSGNLYNYYLIILKTSVSANCSEIIFYLWKLNSGWICYRSYQIGIYCYWYSNERRSAENIYLFHILNRNLIISVRAKKKHKINIITGSSMHRIPKSRALRSLRFFIRCLDFLDLNLIKLRVF